MKRWGGILLLVMALLTAVSCSKEQEFVGVWQATDTRTGYMLVHQFTFRKDNSVDYCVEMPLQGLTECVKGTFTVAEKGEAVALIGNTEAKFTFTKQNKDLYCKELDLHFGFYYK